MSGPGTELKEILKWFDSEGQCKNCTEKAKTMDENGTDWVEENIDTVVRWVVANSKRMFVSRFIPEIIKNEVARQAVLLACSRAKTTKSETENTTGEVNEQTNNTNNTAGTANPDRLRSAAQRFGAKQAAEARETDSQPAPADANKELGKQASIEDESRELRTR